jgi:hypothetical protein
MMWDLATGQQLHMADAEYGSRPRNASPDQPSGDGYYSPDHRRFAKYLNDSVIVIYDTATDEETMRLDVGVGVSQIRFARDGTSMIASDLPEGGLYYWPGKR